jgi:hypothetical protein
VVTLSHSGGEWMGWFIFGLVVGAGISIVVMSMMETASRADDQTLGDRQYYE